MTHYPHERNSRNWLISKMRALQHVTAIASPIRRRATGKRHPLEKPAAGWRVVVLTIGLLTTGIAPALPEQSPLSGTRFEKWRGYTAFESLPDDSTLAEYLGETDALSPAGYRLRVSFMPRFRCEPVISILVRLSEDGDRDRQGRSLTGVEPVSFRIDGDELDLSAIIDDEGPYAVAYVVAPTEQVRALREQIDKGNLAFLLSEAGESIAFSLFGSARTLAEVQARCRQHEPEDV